MSPIIVRWAYSITEFFVSTNKECFGGWDIAGFVVSPLISAIVYFRAGDRVSVNTFRTIGFLVGSTWLSLGIAAGSAFSFATKRFGVPAALLRTEKLSEFLFEAIFFSIFTIAITVVVIEVAQDLGPPGRIRRTAGIKGLAMFFGAILGALCLLKLIEVLLARHLAG